MKESDLPRTFPETGQKMEIQILLATYNSSRFLREQIDSLLAQDWRDFEVLIRDGGSADDTLEIIDDYLRKFPGTFRFLGQARAKAPENFSFLLASSSAPLVMFSDHDDVWKPNKVRVTLEKYRELESEYGAGTPIMVFTDSEVVDSGLNPISRSMFRYQNIDVNALTLNRLIVQNVPSGNTMLVNRALVDLASPIPSAAVMHDHWLSLVATAMGKFGYLAEPTVSYRQHSDNFYGAANYSIPAFLRKLSFGREKIRRRFQQNIDQAVEFGRRYAASLSKKDQEMLEDLKSFQKLGFWGRRTLIWKHGMWKSGVLRNIGTFLFI